jgi:hypothetical protein
MKFSYVALDTILAEIESQFKKLNKQGKYSEEDAYNYAIEASRLIGMNSYDESTALIRIDGHNGAVPRGFHNAGEIYATDAVDATQSPNSILDAFRGGYVDVVAKKQLLYPGNSATVAFCKFKTMVGPDMPSFTLKIPPGIIRTSFKTGYVTMQYYHLPVDERGVIMMQDEINAIKGLKAYVLLNMLKEDYLMQKLPRYIYKDIEAEADMHIDMAKALQKMPPQEGMEAFADMVQNRYNRFKL